MSLTIHRCSICGALRPMRSLAPYYVGEVLRHSCEYRGCRDVAREELRSVTIIVEDEERSAA